MTANALRLSALVAAAMASGYLWRAAIEPGKSQELLNSATPAAIGFTLPDVPLSSLDQLRLVARSSAPVAKRRTALPSASSRGPGASQLIAAVIAVPGGSSGATSGGRSKHASHAGKGKPGSPRGKQPQPRPRPGPPPPPPPPRPAPPPPPPPPVNPPAPPPPPPAGSDTRPGQGKGDRNHSHTGPPGQRRRRSAERKDRARSETEDRGRGESGNRGGTKAKKDKK